MKRHGRARTEIPLKRGFSIAQITMALSRPAMTATSEINSFRIQANGTSLDSPAQENNKHASDIPSNINRFEPTHSIIVSYTTLEELRSKIIRPLEISAQNSHLWYNVPEIQ